MHNLRLVIAATLGILLLSPVVYAGSTTNATTTKNQTVTASGTLAQKCSTLETQWQKDSVAQKNHAGFVKAEKMANSGTKLCTAGKHEDGVERLRTALKEIGLKPSV